MKHIEKNLDTFRSESRLLPQGSAILFWRTPIGSYGYGSVLMRVKLLSPVRLIPIVLNDRADLASMSCARLGKIYGEQTRDTSVFLKYFAWIKGYHEYQICSESVVASWSFGTSEILDEITREEKWVQAHEVGDFDSLWKSHKKFLFTSSKFDNVDWSEKAYRTKIKNLKKLIQGRKGRIIAKDKAAVRQHYYTSNKRCTVWSCNKYQATIR